MRNRQAKARAGRRPAPSRHRLLEARKALKEPQSAADQRASRDQSRPGHPGSTRAGLFAQGGHDAPAGSANSGLGPAPTPSPETYRSTDAPLPSHGQRRGGPTAQPRPEAQPDRSMAGPKAHELRYRTAPGARGRGRQRGPRTGERARGGMSKQPLERPGRPSPIAARGATPLHPPGSTRPHRTGRLPGRQQKGPSRGRRPQQRRSANTEAAA